MRLWLPTIIAVLTFCFADANAQTAPASPPSGSATPEQVAAMQERQQKCAAEWRELQATGKVPEAMKWPEYWNGCNARLRRTSSTPAVGRTSPVTRSTREAPVAATVDSKQIEFKDPAEYCAAVDTIDEPDKRYVGPTATPAMAAAFKLKPDEADKVEWRCMNKAVYACVTFNSPVCGPAGKAAINNDMRQYCQDRPNADFIAAAFLSNRHTTWRCQGTTPVILKQTPTDARGFAKEYWKRM